MKRKRYVRLFLTVIVIAVITACSSYNYSVSITSDSDDIESVEMYFFGIPSGEFENMKMVTYDDFWMKVFNSKGEYPVNRKFFYFGPETTKTQSLDYNDNAWSVWKDTDMKYLSIVAYSPDFTDSSRKDTDWKKIIRLRHFNWWWSSNEKLNVNLSNGVLDIKEE